MATYGPVERAVRIELRSLQFSVMTDGLAATAVALGRSIDNARGAVAAAQAANVLRAILEDLRKRSLERPAESDPVDEIADRRRKRRTGG